MILRYLFVVVPSIVSLFAAQLLAAPSGAANPATASGDTSKETGGLGLHHWTYRSTGERARKQAQKDEYDKQMINLSAIADDLKQKITRMPAGDLKASLSNDVMKLEQTISKLQKAREVHKNRAQERR